MEKKKKLTGEIISAYSDFRTKGSKSHYSLYRVHSLEGRDSGVSGGVRLLRNDHISF